MIVVCGEALMDVFAGDDTPSGTALDARVGGSPFNVAVGLARLKQPVGLLGAISRDFLGDRLIRALTEEGVDLTSVARVKAPTTLGLVGLDALGVPSYAFYGSGGADRQLGDGDLGGLPTSLSAIHVGSYTTVVEPIASTLRRLVDARRGSTTISYDPNVRLNVEPDLGRWRDHVDWMLTRAHLLKVSDEDLSLLYPDVDAATFADRALSGGVRLLVVTRGGQGAIAWTPSGLAQVPPVAVEVIDTVGAGDTFQAALLTWLAEHDRLAVPALSQLAPAEVEQALTFAGAAAAITCSRRGADLPRRAELG